ncbi:MAG: AI-2E family transporter [Gammaproteobacteria bacterium]|nr:AI-2E family transporter [Gammaproteobacteria bacterium]
MNKPAELAEGQQFQKNMMSFVIQLAALAALIAYCIIIVGPFAGLVIWGVVTAVAVYPVHLKLASVFGGREKLSAILIVLLGLAIVLFPGWIMVKSALLSIMTFADNVQAGTVHIPPPAESVESWPLIGERLYESWSNAAHNVEETLAEFQPQLREGMLQIAASTIIAGVTLMYTQSGYNLTQSIAEKVVPGRGKSLTDLSVATIRSVTNGVLGVAFIQAVLLGVGFAVMDVPHAGLLAVVVLITAIIQIPALLIALPVIIWVFSVAEPLPATIFAVYTLVAAASDNVLKPILLGRGVNLPALVVLIGAIGGMIAFGIIGLFLGAVIFGLAYSIGKAWLEGDNTPPAESTDQV